MDRLIRFGKDVVNGWLDAGAFTLAASLAYYAIFSIAPLLLISIHLASLFLDRTAAVEGLTKELIGVIGPVGSDAIKQMLNAAGTAQPQGWVRSGRDDTPGRKAYYINLEAKPGKGDKVEQFLRDILAGVEQEPGTGPWFGCRFSDTTFGIFEAFPDTAARNAHDIGPGGRNFLRSAELDEMLAYPAHLYRLDVMFCKFSVMFGKKITSE
jgi:quinol monooxygenase YgiN